MNEESYKFLELTINRIDSYINSVNNKAAFVIAFNTFILGSLIFKYSIILNLFENEKIRLIVFLLIFVVLFGVSLSLIFCFHAVKPYLKSGNSNGDYSSLLFFGSISKMNIDTYLNLSRQITYEGIIQDLSKQNHVLSEGLTYKFNKMKLSFNCIFFSVLTPIAIILALKILDWIIK
jgi:hypothetical protein